MTIVSQKARYRRQASLCYELAAMMQGEKVAAMVRLGDVYTGLAAASDTRVQVASSATRSAPRCPCCNLRMGWAAALPPSAELPARETFRCRACGETLVCKKS